MSGGGAIDPATLPAWIPRGVAGAQAEALAVLAALANGEPGVLRRRAAAALWRLEIAPRAMAACAQPADAVGCCIVNRSNCARCELNPANG